MANGRGGPPDLKETLVTLFRSTLDQVSTVKDAVERQTRTQRGWLDAAVLARKKRAALADLGALVHELILQGALAELEELPDIANVLTAIDAIDQDIANSEQRGPSAVASGPAKWAESRARHNVPPRPAAGRPWRSNADGADAPPWQSMRSEPADAPSPPARTVSSGRRGGGGGGITFADDNIGYDDDDLDQYMNPEDVPDES